MGQSARTGSRRAVRPRILIVDDAADNREMYCEYLRFAGCVTETAEDAEEGLAMLEAFRPDVVVMDLALPRMDGVEATRRIKSRTATRHIRVIMLSGHLLPDFVERAREAGADAFCPKPCLPEHLLGEIRAVLAADHPSVSGARRKPVKP